MENKYYFVHDNVTEIVNISFAYEISFSICFSAKSIFSNIYNIQRLYFVDERCKRIYPKLSMKKLTNLMCLRWAFPSCCYMKYISNSIRELKANIFLNNRYTLERCNNLEAIDIKLIGRYRKTRFHIDYNNLTKLKILNETVFELYGYEYESWKTYEDDHVDLLFYGDESCNSHGSIINMSLDCVHVVNFQSYYFTSLKILKLDAVVLDNSNLSHMFNLEKLILCNMYRTLTVSNLLKLTYLSLKVCKDCSVRKYMNNLLVLKITDKTCVRMGRNLNLTSLTRLLIDSYDQKRKKLHLLFYRKFNKCKQLKDILIDEVKYDSMKDYKLLKIDC